MEGQLLGHEIRRLKESLLAQLDALRWRVVDFSVNKCSNVGEVELRLRVSSDVWQERCEEQKKATEGKAVESEETRGEGVTTGKSEAGNGLVGSADGNRGQEQAGGEEREQSEDDQRRAKWLECKEQARQKVFAELRKEQNERILFARKRRESFGLRNKDLGSGSAKASAAAAPPETYTDDPFPAVAPLSPNLEPSTVSPVPLEAADDIDALIGPLTTPTVARTIALHTYIPKRKWQAELRPGLVFEVDGRLDLSDSSSSAEYASEGEWWVGRIYGDKAAPRRAVPSRLLHILNGDVESLQRQPLSKILLEEGISEDSLQEQPPAAQPPQGGTPPRSQPPPIPADQGKREPGTSSNTPPVGSDGTQIQVEKLRRLSTASCNQLPTPAFSSEIANAIKERERRKRGVNTDTVNQTASGRTETSSGAPVAKPSQQAPTGGDQPKAQLRPTPPSRATRRSLDPLAPAVTPAPGGVPEQKAVPPVANPAVDLLRQPRGRPLSLPPGMLVKLQIEEALAAGGVDPASDAGGFLPAATGQGVARGHASDDQLLAIRKDRNPALERGRSVSLLAQRSSSSGTLLRQNPVATLRAKRKSTKASEATVEGSPATSEKEPKERKKKKKKKDEAKEKKRKEKKDKKDSKKEKKDKKKDKKAGEKSIE